MTIFDNPWIVNATGIFLLVMTLSMLVRILAAAKKKEKKDGKD